MNAHEEHVTIEAWSADCIEGECEHVDEDGMPDDLSACPGFDMEVCVDCQVERGLTNDPAWWEGALSPWPHEPEDREPSPPQRVVHGPDPEPPIFKTHGSSDPS